MDRMIASLRIHDSQEPLVVVPDFDMTDHVRRPRLCRIQRTPGFIGLCISGLHPRHDDHGRHRGDASTRGESHHHRDGEPHEDRAGAQPGMTTL
jgi:hypothetical protein